MLRLERAAQSIAGTLASEHPDSPPVTHILAAVGGHPVTGGGGGPPGAAPVAESGGHLGEVTIQLTPSESRNIETRDVATRWREVAGAIPDAVELTFVTSLFTVGDAIKYVHSAQS